MLPLVETALQGQVAATVRALREPGARIDGPAQLGAYCPGRERAAHSSGQMIINDTYRFVFVHIPKCAGTTMRDALAPFDQTAELFYDRAVVVHPLLGPLDHRHIPLSVLRDHFPGEFARLAAYRSVALVRDPRSRFPSSLHERFVQRDRKPLSKRDPGEVAREIDTVLDQLARLPADTPITDPELIHFSRQRDYIYLDGTQIVREPRTVAEVDDLMAELSRLTGQTIRSDGTKNRRYAFASPLVEKVQLAITRPIESSLPRRVWKPVYRPFKSIFLATGLMRPGGNPLSELPNSAEIDAFVREFYAADLVLFAETEARRQARLDSGGAC